MTLVNENFTPIKKIPYQFVFILIILFVGCSDDSEIQEDTLIHDPIFFNLTLNDTEYVLESTGYIESQGPLQAGCIESTQFIGGFAHGLRPTHLIAKADNDSFIKEIRFGITEKVGIIDLNLADELNYMQHVLDRSGKSVFPTETDGFQPIRNFIDIPPSEVYLEIHTNDGNIYSSTQEGLLERFENSFFKDTRVLNLGEIAPPEYSYIIEADFKVDLYNNNSITNSLNVEGSFRLPIFTVTTSEAKTQCD